MPSNILGAILYLFCLIFIVYGTYVSYRWSKRAKEMKILLKKLDDLVDPSKESKHQDIPNTSDEAVK